MFQQAFREKCNFSTVCLITKKNQDYSFAFRNSLGMLSYSSWFHYYIKLIDKLNKWQYDNMNVLYVHNVIRFFYVAFAVGKLTNSNHSTNMAQKVKEITIGM